MVVGVFERWEDVYRPPVSPRTSHLQDPWFLWAFTDRLLSSLAMAEMTTLMAAIYRTYSTTIKPGYEGVSPGVTSRFEVFFDENFTQIKVSSDANFSRAVPKLKLICLEPCMLD